MDWKLRKNERYEKKESVFQTYMQLRLEHTFDVHIQKKNVSIPFCGGIVYFSFSFPYLRTFA